MIEEIIHYQKMMQPLEPADDKRSEIIDAGEPDKENKIFRDRDW